jgi:hypothetical protein
MGLCDKDALSLDMTVPIGVLREQKDHPCVVRAFLDLVKPVDVNGKDSRKMRGGLYT